MRFERRDSGEDSPVIFTLMITASERVAARLDDWDRRLIAECEKSSSISDKLLALETIVRRIEEAKHG